MGAQNTRRIVMKKRIVSVLVVAAMTVGMLSGCGSSEKKSSEKDENTLTVWAWD